MECNSGFCVASNDGWGCTEPCVDACPEGWICSFLGIGSEDPAYICLNRGLNLCRPCLEHADCWSGGGDPDDRFTLRYLIDWQGRTGESGEAFFSRTEFFDKLVGTDALRLAVLDHYRQTARQNEAR